jgi:hypothetical protein
VSEDEDVFEIIKPLGLFDTRIRGLREVTERFLSMPRFIIGAIPHALMWHVASRRAAAPLEQSLDVDGWHGIRPQARRSPAVVPLVASSDRADRAGRI